MRELLDSCVAKYGDKPAWKFKRNGKVVSVKTDKPVKKSDLFEIMKKINSVVAQNPLRIGDVIIKNVAEDINVVATDNKD